MQQQPRLNIKLIQLIDQKTGQTQPYVLELDLVGKGYYGAVYKAVHQHNPKRVYAVKVITLKREQTRQQILKQLEIIQKIPKSPNLVDTHKQHLQSKKHLYIFQQFCQGGSLADFKQKMEGKLMREEVAFDLFYQLCKGYLDLYHAGIIHQDIKPSNILLKGKRYKYCDFGVSQLANNLKYEQSRKGTVSYMPPQKLLSKFKPSAKSDIFSLGVTLYEVIFGFHPYLKKKTKNTKEYLTVLYGAQLAPSHELLRRIYNPSLKFNRLINLIQGMICRKHQLRMSIDELKDVLENQEPFRSMRIPEDGQITNGTKQSQNTQQQQQRSKYSNIEISPYISQSKVFVIPIHKNNKPSQQQQQFQQYQQQQPQSSSSQQNRLFSSNVQLQGSQQYKKKREQSLRISKILQQQQNKALQQVFREYHCIQSVIIYLNNGVKTLQQVYNQLQHNRQCNQEYFNYPPFNTTQQLPTQLLKQQSPCNIIHFLILKLNVELMQRFSKNITNYSQKFYQQVKILQQIQYLQAQVSKFIANNQIIREKQVKKGLIKVCSSLTIREYVDVLIRQFGVMFEGLIVGNSVRINFKEDLLNGVFLLHVKSILQKVLILPTIKQPQSMLQQSSSVITDKLSMTQIQQLIKQYNQYRQYKKDKLRECFYKQFEFTQNIMYDVQQNDDQFQLLIYDDQFIQQDQQSQKEEMNGDIMERRNDNNDNNDNKNNMSSAIFEDIDIIQQLTN